MSTIVLTGASSGIGLAMARAFAARGDTVYGLARRTDLIAAEKNPRIIPVACDLTDSASIHQAAAAVALAGGADLLINNAGYGSYGPVETVPISEVRRQLDVNLLGLAELTQLIIPQLRSRGGGRIVNIGSVAGRMTNYLGGWYHVSKYAVEALSDALRMELKDFGIKVVLVEPGPIRTNWGVIAADHLDAAVIGTVYQANGQRAAQRLRMAYTKAPFSSPDAVVRCVLRAAGSRRPRARYHAGLGSGTIIALHALLPTRLFDWGARKVMGC